MKPSSTHSIFVFVGESSGDLHAEHVLRQMLEIDSKIHLEGVVGPRMRALGVKEVMGMEAFRLFGFSTLLWNLPKLVVRFLRLRNAILCSNPDCVLLFDYPGWNLRLAKSLRKKGYSGKIILYNCPTIWAWGKKRKQTLVENFDLLIALFPFEPSLFSDTDLDVRFLGHPLVDDVKAGESPEQFDALYPVLKNREVVSLFPGSRPGEIKRLLSEQIALFKELRSRGFDCMAAISCADASLKAMIGEIAEQSGWREGRDYVCVDEKHNVALMTVSRLALAKSGTVTLELALRGIPSVVVYTVGWIDYLIARYVLRIELSYFCIVNILCEREVFPEFIGRSIDHQKCIKSLQELYREGYLRSAALDGCREVQLLLGQNGASERAARAILEVIS